MYYIQVYGNQIIVKKGVNTVTFLRDVYANKSAEELMHEFDKTIEYAN
jgi:hypothetical protein